MTTTQIQRIKAGGEIVFENEDLHLSATVDSNTKGEFRIWFNGAFIKITKTFKSIETKMDELILKHDLKAAN